MDNRFFMEELQTSFDGYKLYVAVFRWFVYMSLKKAFFNFKYFLQKPTIRSTIFLILLTTPSAIIFHLLFNKIGFNLRFSAIVAISTPIIISLFLVIGYQYYAHQPLKTVVINFIFTRMIEFNFEAAYQEKPRNFNESQFVVNHAMKSDDQILKFFALKQLQRDCSGTSNERKPIYSLSQPGGHPRNWIALRDITIELVRRLQDRLQSETRARTIQTTFPYLKSGFNGSMAAKNGLNDASNPLDRSNNSPIVLNELYEGKQSFFIPPTLKPRSTDQFLAEIKQQRVRLPYFIETIFDKIRQIFLFCPPTISTYEILCTLLTIQALSNIIIHSLEEDHFGVVQRDLRLCLSTLTRLSIAIDSYVKTNARINRARALHDVNIHILDQQLAGSLKEIRDVFGPYINDLELSSIEVDVFKILV